MAGGGEPAPELSVPLRRVSGLRYGENPHQLAAFYSDLSLAEAGRGGIAGAIQHHGKEVNCPRLLTRTRLLYTKEDPQHGCAHSSRPIRHRQPVKSLAQEGLS